MLPRHLRPFVTLFAFTATLLAIVLAPRWVSAAILPTCDSRELSPIPAEWLAPPLLADMVACTLGELPAGDDLGDGRVAAMCDDRGASMVAPPLVHAIADARIDAAPGCLPELTGPCVGPSPDHAPLGAPAFAVLDLASLGDALSIPPAPSELGPPFVVTAGAARAGVKHRIDHPPR